MDSFSFNLKIIPQFGLDIDHDSLVLAVFFLLGSLCLFLIKIRNIYFYFITKIIQLLHVSSLNELIFLLRICFLALSDLLLGRKQQYRVSPTPNINMRGALPLGMTSVLVLPWTCCSFFPTHPSLLCPCANSPAHVPVGLEERWE